MTTTGHVMPPVPGGAAQLDEPPTGEARPWGRHLVEYSLRYGVYLVLGLVLVLASIVSPKFLTGTNLANIGVQVSAIGVMAVGMTYVIIVRGIDVSVGMVLGLTSAVGAAAMLSGVPFLPFDTGAVAWPLALVLMLGVGALIGLVNGVATAHLAMPAFLVTLATFQVASGLRKQASGSQDLFGMPAPVQQFGSERFFGVPLLVVAAVAVFLLGHLVLAHTVFGRQVYAVGGNPEAARVSGIPVNRVVVWCFVIGGACAGLGGIFLTARLNAYSPTSGNGFEFTVIAAVVIGGTSLFGGRGKMTGTLAGVILLGVINNMLNLADVADAYQDIVRGGIIFIAVFLDALTTRYIARHSH